MTTKAADQLSTTSIQSFGDCVSSEERKQRLGVAIINGLIWVVLLGLAVLSFGAILIPYAIVWLINWVFSEVNVRRVQSLGCTVGPEQFPTVFEAFEKVHERFGVRHRYKLIVLHSGEMNAFAVKFAKRKVVVILSELLEAVIENNDQLQALLGHELCHTALDHGWRGVFEIHKSMRYRAARELTCDNAGLVAAGNVEAAKTLIKKLCVGRRLHKLLNETALQDEAAGIYRGIAGWFVRRYLSHPPAGIRLQNLEQFAEAM